MFDSLLFTRFAELKKIKSDLTWHRTGKGAPGLNLFLNLPGPPGSQLKINVHFQHFTKKEKKESHILLVPNLVLVVSVRTVSWFR